MPKFLEFWMKVCKLHGHLNAARQANSLCLKDIHYSSVPSKISDRLRISSFKVLFVLLQRPIQASQHRISCLDCASN